MTDSWGLSIEPVYSFSPRNPPPPALFVQCISFLTPICIVFGSRSLLKVCACGECLQSRSSWWVAERCQSTDGSTFAELTFISPPPSPTATCFPLLRAHSTQSKRTILPRLPWIFHARVGDPLPLDPPPPKDQSEHRGKKRNHLEERLLDQAQARASYTPLFWGHSRSIPQGMILDVQPLVKSLFCPIRPSPNGFFDFEASTP